MGMKRFLLFILSVLMFLPLNAETNDVKLFSTNEELQTFKVEEVNEEDRSYYENMKISLLVGGPGGQIWENFGHSAFIVEAPESPAVTFDWGIFTFDENFFPSFMLGRLYYEVWQTYAVLRIDSLIESDRDVSIIELNLNPNQKKALYSFLLYNTREENRTYLYLFFDDNCATKLRDLYSYATGGDFERYLKSQESTETIRESVARYLSRSTFFSSFIINYLLGPVGDRKITRWDECYLPDNLLSAVEDYEGTEAQKVYVSKNRAETPKKWSLPLYSLLFGLILSALSILSSKTRHHTPWDLVLALIFLFFAVMSFVLIFFDLFTMHYAMQDNIHILIISPLCLISSILHFSSIGKKRKERELSLTGALMALLVLLVMLFKLILPGVLVQNIWAAAAAVLPLYISEALPIFKRKRD